MLVNSEKMSFMAVKERCEHENKSSAYLKPQSPKSMYFISIIISLLCCKYSQIHITVYCRWL